jgi:NAD(P)-dependent dehydrogenase (short-subunit alcohol dehydrogenase family)
LDLKEARRTIDSKLVAAFVLAKHVRIGPRGSITFTAGLAKDRPRPTGSVVAAVNGALVSLARALAVEMAPVRVNVVSPGVVDTPLWDAISGDEKEARLAKVGRTLPVGRVGTTEELAQAYLYLMQNGFTTGTAIHVDGGHALV